MSIKITYDDRQVVKAVQSGLLAVQNLSPAMADIEGELLALSDQAFLTNSDPTTGTGWRALKPSTVAARTRQGYSPAEILQRIGTLKTSVQADSGDTFAQIGASVEYSLVHFVGGGNNIPARPFVGASPSDLNLFESIISKFIENEING